MKVLQESIDAVIKRIDENTNLFYQNKKNNGYEELNETLRLISDVIEEILSYEQRIFGKKVSEQKLVGILSDALNALEKRDELLLSDVLQYDLKELFVQYQESLIQ